MRAASRIAAEILETVSSLVKPGVCTIDLEQRAIAETEKRGAKPAFKGYQGYPYALCCSPNSQVVHGMPSTSPLRQGDIISLDFGILYDGFFGDAARTVPVGKIDAATQDLLTVTEESLYSGISKARVGGRLYDISAAVQSHVESRGYSVVRDFVGHGIGRSLHEDPQIPNYGRAGKGIALKAGMVFAIEPMINQGGHEVMVLEDGWTVRTSDGSLSAHFEHTVAITEKGPDILTKL